MNTERFPGVPGGPAAPGASRRSGFAALFVMALALLTVVATITPAAAARRAGGTVTVEVVNNSDRDLIGSAINVAHGCLLAPAPGRINAGTTGRWTAVACGDLAGTEGTVSYQVAGEGTATVDVGWIVPLAGENSFTQKAPTGYVVSLSGGADPTSPARFTFDCNSTTCDGIPDDWKRNGVTINPGNGAAPQFIDLPKMGADVNKPDVFVQLDWMAGTAHSHALDPQAIRKVVDAFAKSPFNRHSPTTGINLHVDAGPNSVLNFATGATWGTLSKAKALTETTNLGVKDANGMYTWNAFNALKTATTGGFVNTGRASIFHYAISAHNLEPGSGSSGISAGTPASDFIVSLGSFTNSVGTVNEQAGTFMHELGHNLGLRHGGDFDLPNHRPQYFSVMNYSYQMGLASGTTTGLMDYSRQAASLQESSLNERQYPGSTGSFDVRHYCAKPTGGGSFVTVLASAGQVDWNCNGMIEENPVSADTNNDGQITALTGHDDWNAVQLRGGSISHPGDSGGVPAPTPDDELAPDEAAMDLPVDTTPPVTTATTYPHPGKHQVHHEDVTVTLTATDDISGVARTEYNLDGAGWREYTGPVRVGGDGEHTLLYRSVDHSQNLEETRSLTIRIDCDGGRHDGWQQTS
ncbi:OmpL47-type beta-barrel domain-containing protein [Kitasatospora sp. NPDC088346]|uniref:OmpL47-type beta-barrel domain-containing protein n=1 Tax=Kitasatospora sp. NPDC088346 TaxID=3364073 RepID=UPI0038158E0B